MGKEVVIEIDKKGNCTFEVFGAKGKGCLDLTRDLEMVVGREKKITEKQELRQGGPEKVKIISQNARK